MRLLREGNRRRKSERLDSEQKISVKEAIACYTINMHMPFFESRRKKYFVGKLRDFVVLNET